MAHAQLAQCLFPLVTAHTYTDSWVGTVPIVYTSDFTQGTNRLGFEMQVTGAYDTSVGGHQYYSVTQTFAGYVRVKWIGSGTPSPTIAYQGKFHVWGLRRIEAYIAFLKATPARSMITDATASGVHVEIPSTVHISGSTPPKPPPIQGLIGLATAALALGDPLPTTTNAYNWTYLGQVVTGGVFVPDGSGGYIADMDLTDGVIHDSDWQGTGMHSPVDALWTDTITRVCFELYEVGGQPVVP